MTEEYIYSQSILVMVLALTLLFTVLRYRAVIIKSRRNEGRYRILTEQIKDVVWVMDVETLKFLYVSPSVEKLRGYSAEEIMSESIIAALTPEGARFVKGLINERAEKLKTGEITSDDYFIDEVEQPCKDGSSVWTEVSCNYNLNPETGKIEVRGVTRDISDRKRVYDQLELRNRELEEAMTTIKTISGIVPICAWCHHQIRDTEGRWIRIEKYFETHTEATISHGMCPNCQKGFTK